jgi:hypothetical protein
MRVERCRGGEGVSTRMRLTRKKLLSRSPSDPVNLQRPCCAPPRAPRLLLRRVDCAASHGLKQCCGFAKYVGEWWLGWREEMKEGGPVIGQAHTASMRRVS